jgi:hypothetical protein
MQASKLNKNGQYQLTWVYNTISGNKTLKAHTCVSKVIIIDSFAKLGGKWMTYLVWDFFLNII